MTQKAVASLKSSPHPGYNSQNCNPDVFRYSICQTILIIQLWERRNIMKLLGPQGLPETSELEYPKP